MDNEKVKAAIWWEMESEYVKSVLSNRYFGTHSKTLTQPETLTQSAIEFIYNSELERTKPINNNNMNTEIKKVSSFEIEKSKVNESRFILVAITETGERFVCAGDCYNPTYLIPYNQSFDTKPLK